MIQLAIPAAIITQRNVTIADQVPIIWNFSALAICDFQSLGGSSGFQSIDAELIPTVRMTLTAIQRRTATVAARRK